MMSKTESPGERIGEEKTGRSEMREREGEREEERGKERRKEGEGRRGEKERDGRMDDLTSVSLLWSGSQRMPHGRVLSSLLHPC